MGADPSSAEGPHGLRVVGDGNPLYVLYAMRQIEIRLPTFDASETADAGDESVIRAPIIGRVAKVFVKQGDTRGQGRSDRRGRSHEDGASPALPP